MYKLVAPEFFEYEVSVEEYYNDAIGDAIANGDEGVFCHFEGDRHCMLPVSLLKTLDLSKVTIHPDGFDDIAITDDTVFE